MTFEIARFEVSDDLSFRAVVSGPLISYAHFHFYCMVCGEVWGRRTLLTGSLKPCNTTREQPSHHYIPRDCFKHGGGTLIEPEDDFESLPRELLEYEFIRMFYQLIGDL